MVYCYYRIVLLLVLSVLCILIHSSNNHPTVNTRYGKVEGISMKFDGKNIDAFLGVPYAKSPTGEHRFKKACPMKPWKGTYQAKRPPPSCLQYLTRVAYNMSTWLPVYNTNEDCLYINIWVPNIREPSKGSPKTVMVWIYGGAVIVGGIDVPVFDGRVLSSYGDVIVVTFNYRLGIFGGLALRSKDEVPGNLYITDQILALHWIKDNIELFGGDPNKIVLFGQSAGAMAIGIHMFNPPTKYIFQRAILQSSASTIGHFAIDPEVFTNRTYEVIVELRCSRNVESVYRNPDKALRCLRHTPAEKIQKAQSRVLNRYNLQVFVPAVGKDGLDKNPFAAYYEGDDFGRQQEILIGKVKSEGSLLMHFISPNDYLAERPKEDEHTFARAEKFLGKMLSFLQERFVKPIIRILLSSIQEDTNPEKINDLVAQTVGDLITECPIQYTVEKFSDSNRKVYFYELTERPSHSNLGEWYGATHGEADLPFVFGMPLLYPENYTSEDIEYSKTIMDIWVTFAKTGKPPNIGNGTEWPLFTTENENYIKIKKDGFEIHQKPDNGRCSMWSYFYEFFLDLRKDRKSPCDK